MVVGGGKRKCEAETARHGRKTTGMYAAAVVAVRPDVINGFVRHGISSDLHTHIYMYSKSSYITCDLDLMTTTTITVVAEPAILDIMSSCAGF